MRWVVRLIPDWVKPKTMKLVFVASPRSIKEKEQRLAGSESGYCIRVGWHVYLTIILEIMHFSVNELKRCLITLHLSLNDLLRRSVDLMRSAYTNHYQTRTIRRNRNSNKIVLSGSCVFRATVLSKAAVTFVLVLVLTVSLVSCSTSSVKRLIM